MTRLTIAQQNIVRFCAIECSLQESGEVSVWHMLKAWDYAQEHSSRLPGVGDVLALGECVDPARNSAGYRRVGVRVGYSVKMDWAMVPHAMEKLVARLHENTIEPDEFFRQYEEIHPFRDGNGRTGQILFNWLNGTLDDPVWAPDFWGDPRRHPGWGA